MLLKKQRGHTEGEQEVPVTPITLRAGDVVDTARGRGVVTTVLKTTCAEGRGAKKKNKAQGEGRGARQHGDNSDRLPKGIPISAAQINKVVSRHAPARLMVKLDTGAKLPFQLGDLKVWPPL